MSLGNQTLHFPAGIRLLYSNNTKKCDTPDCVISTILLSTSFNPYINIKSNTIINNASLENISLPNNKLPSSKIQKIYEELRNSSKYDTKINKKKSYSKYISVSLGASKYSLREKHKLINTTLAFDNLTTKDLFKVLIQLTESVEKLRNSFMIPVYYIETTRSWSNEMCYIEKFSGIIPSTNVSEVQEQKNLTNYALISCSKIGANNQFPYPQVSLVLAVDCLEDLDQINEATISELRLNVPVLIASGIILFVLISYLLLFLFERKKILVTNTNANKDKILDITIPESPSLVQYIMFIHKIGYLGFIKKWKDMKNAQQTRIKEESIQKDNAGNCSPETSSQKKENEKCDLKQQFEPGSPIKAGEPAYMIQDINNETCCRLIIVQFLKKTFF